MLESFHYRKAGWVFFLTCISFHSFGQRIDNIRVTVLDDEITVMYDLLDAPDNREFYIELYSSHNNYSAPVKAVSGDAGPNVFAGRSKVINWRAKDELINYKGELILEVRARATITARAIQNPEAKSTKRGKTMPITWEGGQPGEKVELSLVKEGSTVATIGTVPNNGSYNWNVPAKNPTGKFQISLKSENGRTISTPVSVKSRVPLYVKLLPIAAVGIGVSLLGGSNGEKGGGLPRPPEPN